MPLTFPKTKEILDLVELLIGEKPVFRKGEGWDLTSPDEGCYITFLQGKNKKVEGAIVTDLPATLYIGGKLILLPESQLMNQAQDGEADQPIVEALTEVVNNLRTLFNNIDMNPHVAPTKTYEYVVPTEDDLVGWILNPGKRVDYVGETKFGKATLTLIAP
ncbi:hypothetical protein KDM41_09020 [bacterium]|nr:hypothetical protein [bacterium]